MTCITYGPCTLFCHIWDIYHGLSEARVFSKTFISFFFHTSQETNILRQIRYFNKLQIMHNNHIMWNLSIVWFDFDLPWKEDLPIRHYTSRGSFPKSINYCIKCYHNLRDNVVVKDSEVSSSQVQSSHKYSITDNLQQQNINI